MKRWTPAPQNPLPRDFELTDVARAIWSAIFPERPWPEGWAARWGYGLRVNGARTAAGICDYRRKLIELDYRQQRHPDPTWGHCPVNTMVHELLHMAGHSHHDGGGPAAMRSLNRYEAKVRRYMRALWKAAA